MEERAGARSISNGVGLGQGGQAVQIVNVKTLPSRQSQFVLEKTSLRQILKQVGNRNIYVLSIAGASRQGKSFLMNVIRHFLEEMEKGEESPWENIMKKESLQGFRIENRNVRDTIGFWMWSRPFIFKQSNGNEIAVLLMDTQGVFDQFSTKREWSMIVGLSLLTSSCVIYNLLNNLQEDNLEIFNNFVEFGMLTLKTDTSATSAFHKLLFLIRDWGFPCDTAYGALGGSQFIENKLNTHSEMPDDLQQVRKTIRSVFDEIECFLMPHPGTAAKKIDYNGSLRNLDPDFLQNLEDFLTNVLIIDDLRPLSIGGQTVTGQGLLNYFGKYIDLLNKQETPNAKSIYEATTEAKLEAVSQEYVSIVVREIEDSIAQKNFLTATELKNEYETSCKKVMSYFREKNRNQKPEVAGHYASILVEELKKLGNSLSAKNSDSKKQFVTSLLESVKADFKNRVETGLQGSIQTSSDMETILGECKGKTLENLQLGNRDEGFFNEVLPQIKSMMEIQSSFYRKNNASQLETIESSYRHYFEPLLQEYEEKMSFSVPDDELPMTAPDKLLKMHQKCENVVVQKLFQLATFENERLKEKAATELKTLMTEKVAKRAEVVKKSRSSSKTQAMNLVQQAVQEYCSQMDEFLKGNNPTEKELIAEHRAVKADAKEVMSRISNIMKDFSETEEIKQVLEDKITESFEGIKAKIAAEKRRFRSQWESAVHRAESKYAEESEKFMKTLPHPDENQFAQHAQFLQNNIIRTVGEVEKFSDEDIIAVRNEVQQRLSTLQKNQMTAYISIITDAQERCLDNAKECVKQYSSVLKGRLEKEKDQLTINSFYDISKHSCNEMKIAFESKWARILPRPVMSKVVTELSTMMEGTYTKHSEVLETRIREVTLKIEEIVNECCEMYSIEMEEKMDDKSDSSKLERIHKTSQKKAEKEFNKMMKEYSHFPQMDRMTQKFHNDIQLAYEQQQQFVEQYQLNLDLQLDRIQQSSADFYRKNFAKERAAIKSQEELRSTHEEGKKLALKHLKQKMYEQKAVSFDRYFEQEEILESRLDSELDKQMEEWNSLNKAIDEQTKAAMQEIMNTYQHNMNDQLEKCEFLSPIYLQQAHEMLLADGLKRIRCTKKPQNADPAVYEKQLTQDLCNTFNIFVNENQDKRRAAMSEVNMHIGKLANEYATWLASHKTAHTQKAWNTERSKYLDNTRQFCVKFKVPGGLDQEFLDKCNAEMTTALDAAQAEWENLEPLESDLELAIIKTRKVYEKEMDSHITRESPLLRQTVLKHHHKKALDKAMKDFQICVKQTTKAKAQLEEMLGIAFMRYQDENDAKAADAGHTAVGIDLGTTYSCVALYRKGDVEIIPDRNNHKPTVPSYVLFESKVKCVVGEEAKEQSVIYPHTTVFDSKRLIGRRFKDTEVQQDKNLWPFEVVSENNRPKIKVHGESFFPEEISGKILEQLKKNAELHLGHEVKRAVITVPAYFSDAQKRATKAAADFAGLEVLELLSEPTAAAIAYNFHYNDDKARNLFVYDLGGGTFDVSILTSQKGKMDVKAVGGNNHLGGQDFDNAMVKYCVAEFEKKHKLSVEAETDQRQKDTIIRRIRNRCETAKINLSKSEKVRVILDKLCQDKDMDVEITRKQFNRMIEPMLQETINTAKAALTESKLTVKDISDVVLVGGSSRIPRAQELLKELFERDALSMALNPDEVVARGAAYRAAMLSGSKERELGNIKFNNVTPFALGTSVRGDLLSIIIPKNTPVPTKQTKIYYTVYMNQTSVDVSIYEGEDRVASENNLLADFTLTGIPPAPPAKEPIEVIMELDEEGLLTVTAVCQSTGGSKDIKVETLRTGLTKQEVAEQKARHK